MDLGEERLLARPFQRPPALHFPLQGPELPVSKKPLMRPLQVLKNGFCLEAGRRSQKLPNFFPDIRKRIFPCFPCMPDFALTRQLPGPEVFSGGLFIHPAFGGRCPQRFLSCLQHVQFPDLTILNHPGLLPKEPE